MDTRRSSASRRSPCRVAKEAGAGLEPVDRLAVAFAVGVVHGGEQVGCPRQLELDDGQCEAGMTLEGAGEDQIAQRQRRSFLGAGRSRFCYDQRGWERP